MIFKKTIEIQISRSQDELSKEFERFFKNMYIMTDVENNIFRFKKKRIYMTNHWEPILKQLSFDDTLVIKTQFDKLLKITISFKLTRQIFVTFLSLLIVFFMLWRLFSINIIYSLIISIFLVIIIWINISIEGKRILNLFGNIINQNLV